MYSIEDSSHLVSIFSPTTLVQVDGPTDSSKPTWAKLENTNFLKRKDTFNPSIVIEQERERGVREASHRHQPPPRINEILPASGPMNI